MSSLASLDPRCPDHGSTTTVQRRRSSRSPALQMARNRPSGSAASPCVSPPFIQSHPVPGQAGRSDIRRSDAKDRPPSEETAT